MFFAEAIRAIASIGKMPIGCDWRIGGSCPIAGSAHGSWLTWLCPRSGWINFWPRRWVET